MSRPDTGRDLVAELLAIAPAAATDAAMFQHAVADQIGLNLSEVKCLGELLAGPGTVGAIADRLGLSSGAVTRIVDKLARVGYLRREPDPSDRRRVLVVGVPERLDEVSALYHGMAQAWRDFLAECTPDQLAFLHTVLTRMREATRLEVAKLRAR